MVYARLAISIFTPLRVDRYPLYARNHVLFRYDGGLAFRIGELSFQEVRMKRIWLQRLREVSL